MHAEWTGVGHLFGCAADRLRPSTLTQSPGWFGKQQDERAKEATSSLPAASLNPPPPTTIELVSMQPVLKTVPKTAVRQTAPTPMHGHSCGHAWTQLWSACVPS